MMMIRTVAVVIASALLAGMIVGIAMATAELWMLWGCR